MTDVLGPKQDPDSGILLYMVLGSSKFRYSYIVILYTHSDRDLVRLHCKIEGNPQE
jgi:hypothetical protein